MLPYVVQWLGLSRLAKKEHKDEIKAELRARKAALKQVERRLEKAIRDHDLPAEAIAHLRTRHQSRVQILPTNLTEGLDHMRQTAKVKAELIGAEREFIYQLLRDGKITDEARRRIECRTRPRRSERCRSRRRRRRLDVRRASSPVLFAAPGRPTPFFRFPKRGMERREGARGLRDPSGQPLRSGHPRAHGYSWLPRTTASGRTRPIT